MKLLVSCWILLCSCAVHAGPKKEYGKVELLRDKWGIPHLFAESDAGAMYGLGYAMADDRGFQMNYSLRLIQGRLAEIVGEMKMLNRNETSVDHDRKMRIFGFYRAARQTAAQLDPESRALLDAFSEGVNDRFAAQAAAKKLHPLFDKLGISPERWTAADCLAIWFHLGQFFATDGTRDLIAARHFAEARPDQLHRDERATPSGGRDAGLTALPRDLKPMPPDDGPAVVTRTDVPAEWVEQVERYASEKGLKRGENAESPKFSHAWVVGGKRTTTGSSVLVSDPQTPVRNPSLLYEFHVQGKTFNARGVGVAGSPVILIGFTDHVAWGMTALGADQADLFRLQTHPEHPDQYRFDGEWHKMAIHREVIHIKGREARELFVRETHLGPVATALAFARPDEGEVALKRIPICETDRDTIQGAIAMMRAKNSGQFGSALEGWRFPSANVVFGDREGTIGYRVVGAIPVRSRHVAGNGQMAMPGHSSEHDWQEILPYGLLPRVDNPASGFLYSGNHRPIESWYPLSLGAMTGGGGDTLRSWRLRERLEAKTRFKPEEVRDIHFDSVNPARRDIVRIGLHLRDGLKRELEAEAVQALSRLEPWYRSGASSSLASKGAEVAVELNTFFRFAHTVLAHVYGGGESGLSYFLKTVTTRMDRNPTAELSAMEQEFIEQALTGAWRAARQKYGPDPEVWNQKARDAVRERKLGYFETLDGFPSVDPAHDLKFPALNVTDGGTLNSQAAQSYTQWVPMHAPDEALTILPIGQSERPDSPYRLSTMNLWSENRLRPAPLARERVEAVLVSRQRLDSELD